MRFYRAIAIAIAIADADADADADAHPARRCARVCRRPPACTKTWQNSETSAAPAFTVPALRRFQ
jgi:hypothetical protein